MRMEDIRQGLSRQEAAQLQATYGKNKLPEDRKLTKIDHLISQFASPLIYILVIAGFITFMLQDYKDTVVIFAAVLVNTLLGYYQESKAEEALGALKNMLSPEAKVIRDGRKQKIPAEDLVPGDIVILAEGDKIPADGSLREAVNFSANESMLTGESTAVRKEEKAEVYMGTNAISGRAVMVVTATGQSTKMGSIAKQITLIDNSKTPLQERISQLAHILAGVVLLLSVCILVIGLMYGMPFIEIFSTSVALAVAAIPEGMAISLTVILAVGMQRILGRKAIVRRLVAAETLGSVTVIATDKTGTLTEGLMKVVKTDIHDTEEGFKTAVYANNLEDPLEIALWEWAQKNSIDPQAMVDKSKREHEVPFNSDRKYMSVTINGSQYVKGAPEIVLKMTNESKEKKKEIMKTIQEWSEEGLRIVGLAVHHPRHKKHTWIGLVGMEDPVRKNIKSVISSCSEAGIRVVMITGDYAGTAKSVWHKIHFDADPNVLDGKNIEKLSDSELHEKVRSTDVYARVSPTQKLRIVEALKKNGEVVALVGDGVNDAPALKQANIGIVVGSASDVSKETADMILLDSNFKTIVAAIEEGRGIFQNMKKVILYLLSTSFTEIFIVTGALIIGLPIPLTAAQILWINVVTDGFPAISLTFEPKNPNILKRKPIDPKLPLLDREIVLLIGIIHIVTGVASLAIFLHYYNTASLDVARTVTFAALAFGTLVYIFSVRSLRDPVFYFRGQVNKILFIAVGIGVVLQLLSLFQPHLREFLGNEIMTLNQWYVVGLFTIAVIVIIEITKYIFAKLYD